MSDIHSAPISYIPDSPGDWDNSRSWGEEPESIPIVTKRSKKKRAKAAKEQEKDKKYCTNGMPTLILCLHTLLTFVFYVFYLLHLCLATKYTNSDDPFNAKTTGTPLVKDFNLDLALYV